MPVVRAGIAPLLGEPHRVTVLAQHKRSFAAIVQPQGSDSPRSTRLCGVLNAGQPPPPGTPRKSSPPIADEPGAVAPLGQHDPVGPKQRQVAAGNPPIAHQPQTSGCSHCGRRRAESHRSMNGCIPDRLRVFKSAFWATGFRGGPLAPRCLPTARQKHLPDAFVAADAFHSERER